MVAIERVSMLDSNETALNSDYDFSAYELWMTDDTSWVLFSNLTTKPEFNLSWTWTIDISSWKAIIVCTRATSNPITNKKIAVRYELSETKSLSTSSWDKVYIEIDQTLINDPTLIQDTYPSTDYSQWKNIWTLKASQTYPLWSNYLKLRENNLWVWSDVRVSPKINWNKTDLSNLTQSINTTWSVTATNWIFTTVITPNWDIQDQIDQINIDVWLVDSIYLNNIIAWEQILAWQPVFMENMIGFSSATNIKKIWDISSDTRISIKAFWSWIQWSEIKLSLKKFSSPSVDLWLRIETDSNWVPSWNLVSPSATLTIPESSLTTSLQDITSQFTWVSITNSHWVTLNNTQTQSSPHKWVFILMNSQSQITSVTKNTWCNATTCYIYSSDWVLLTQSPFVWNSATISYSWFVAWQEYFVTAWSWQTPYTSIKQSWTLTFPYTSTWVNFLSWYQKESVSISEWWFNTSQFLWYKYWQSWWMKIRAEKDVIIKSVSRKAWWNNQRWWSLIAYLYNETRTTLIWQATFSWLTANFWNIRLVAWTTYYLITWTFWQYYEFTSISYPQWWTNVSFLSWWNDVFWDTTTECWIFTDIETAEYNISDNNIYNIVSVDTLDNFLIPRWTPVWIVLYAWNYWSETINWTNHFWLWYWTENTTMRYLSSYNWTSRWSSTYIYDNFISYDTNIWTKTWAMNFNWTAYVKYIWPDTFLNMIETNKSIDASSDISIQWYCLSSCSTNSCIINWWIYLYQDSDNYFSFVDKYIDALWPAYSRIKIVLWWVIIYDNTEAYRYQQLKIDRDTSANKVYFYYYNSWRQLAYTYSWSITWLWKWVFSWFWESVFQQWIISIYDFYMTDFIYTEQYPINPNITWLFPYCASDYFKNRILWLTDWSLIYKSDMLWLAHDDISIWELWKIDIKWLNTSQSSLVYWTEYYLSWVWTIDISWPYNVRVWKTISDTEIMMSDKDVYKRWTFTSAYNWWSGQAKGNLMVYVIMWWVWVSWSFWSFSISPDNSTRTEVWMAVEWSYWTPWTFFVPSWFWFTTWAWNSWYSTIKTAYIM